MSEPPVSPAAKAESVAPAPVAPGSTSGNAAWVAVSYFVQGLPFSLAQQVSGYFFKTQLHLGLALYGKLEAWLGIPWAIKFSWSPLVDARGSRRRWTLVCQAIMVALVAALALVAARASASRWTWSFALLLALGFVSATHDIALDGFYLEVLDEPRQAALSGLQSALYRIALLFGSGLLVWLAGKTSFRVAFLAAAVALAVCSASLHRLLPRAAAAAPRPKRAPAASFVESARTFLGRPGAREAVAYILLFKLGDALMFPMVVPFLADRHMPIDQMGLYNGTIGTACLLGASMLGGVLIARRGLRRAMVSFGLTQDLAIPLYALAARSAHLSMPMLGAIAAVEKLAAGFGNAAYMIFVMRQCAPEHRASHMAFATSLMALTSFVGSYAGGRLAARLDYPAYFTLAAVLAVPSVVLSIRASRRPECAV